MLCKKCNKLETNNKDGICIICVHDAQPYNPDMSDFPKVSFQKGKRAAKGSTPFSNHYTGGENNDVSGHMED